MLPATHASTLIFCLLLTCLQIISGNVFLDQRLSDVSRLFSEQVPAECQQDIVHDLQSRLRPRPGWHHLSLMCGRQVLEWL